MSGRTVCRTERPQSVRRALSLAGAALVAVGTLASCARPIDAASPFSQTASSASQPAGSKSQTVSSPSQAAGPKSLTVDSSSQAAAPGSRAPSGITTAPEYLRWSNIYRTSNPKELLIPVEEGTRDRSSHCWAEWRASVVSTSPVLSVGLKQTKLPGNDCAAFGVSGPFYAAVRLDKPFTGNSVVDAADHVSHRVASKRIDLSTLKYPPQ